MPGLVIIPAYNEEAAIGRVLAEVRGALPEGADLVVVDDGSRDRTAAEVEKAGVRLCRLPCNLGYTNALRTGLLYGLERGCDWFAFMDADGQHRTEDMRALIAGFAGGGADLIVGSRWLERGPGGGAPLGRRIGMRFFSWLTALLTGRTFTDTTSGMKIMNRAVAEELLRRHFGDFHSEVLVYLHDRGYRLRELPITVRERTTGTSMYSLVDAVFYPWKNLILIGVFKVNSLLLRRVPRC